LVLSRLGIRLDMIRRLRFDKPADIQQNAACDATLRQGNGSVRLNND